LDAWCRGRTEARAAELDAVDAGTLPYGVERWLSASARDAAVVAVQGGHRCSHHRTGFRAQPWRNHMHELTYGESKAAPPVAGA